MSRRTALDIVEDILLVALKSCSKTHIMYRANLSFAKTRKYIDFLLRLDLIATNFSSEGKQKFRTTEKGKAFLNQYREAVKLLS